LRPGSFWIVRISEAVGVDDRQSYGEEEWGRTRRGASEYDFLGFCLILIGFIDFFNDLSKMTENTRILANYRLEQAVEVLITVVFFSRNYFEFKRGAV
jgi:hypothetical protein